MKLPTNKLDPTLPFGGKLIILGGDPHQTLPIVKSGKRAQILLNSIVPSALWHHFQRAQLTVDVRHDGDELEFYQLAKKLAIHPSENFELPHSVQRVDCPPPLIRQVFYENGQFQPYNKLIVTPVNDNVNEINRQALDMLPTQTITYHATDTTVNDISLGPDPDMLSNITMSELSPSELRLIKINAQAIILQATLLTLPFYITQNTKKRAT
ncbi:hypothetical protein MP228_000731 [Amoeboaphelidium protococcarum]|nr:hypothetical protein MP228_000731 [Amoeboaphelidium protococcarum]